MRKTMTSIAAATLLLLSLSANADVAQVWECELEDDKTNDDLMALSQSWLKAAKGISADATVRIYFPVAADADEGSFVFIFYMPDFKSWGAFNDAYPDSPVAQVDAGWDAVAPCETSGLWEAVDIQ